MKYKRLKFGEPWREKATNVEFYYTHWDCGDYRVTRSHSKYGCNFEWECPGKPKCTRKHNKDNWYVTLLKNGMRHIVWKGTTEKKAFSACRKHAAAKETK